MLRNVIKMQCSILLQQSISYDVVCDGYDSSGVSTEGALARECVEAIYMQLL